MTDNPCLAVKFLPHVVVSAATGYLFARAFQPAPEDFSTLAKISDGNYRGLVIK